MHSLCMNESFFSRRCLLFPSLLTPPPYASGLGSQVQTPSKPRLSSGQRGQLSGCNSIRSRDGNTAAEGVASPDAVTAASVEAPVAVSVVSLTSSAPSGAPPTSSQSAN